MSRDKYLHQFFVRTPRARTASIDAGSGWACGQREGRYTATLGRQTMDGLRRGLVAFLETQRL